MQPLTVRGGGAAEQEGVRHPPTVLVCLCILPTVLVCGEYSPSPTAPATIDARAEADDDGDRVLQRMGYRPELRRGFSGVMSFAFGYTVLSPVTAISMLYSYGLETGGPACMIWGWILFSIFTLLVGCVLAEICSSYPCAGSVYHWSGQMGGRFTSYMCGWFNFLANVADMASTAYAFSQALNAAITIEGSYPGLTPIHQVLISICVVVAWAVLNIMRVERIGQMSNVFATWQACTTVAIVAAVLILPRERNTSEFVWTTTVNKTGFQSMPYVASLGLLFSAYTQAGIDSGAHMAEETFRAARNAPRGIMCASLAVTVGGFIYALGLLYSTTDVEGALASGNATIATFVSACGLRTGKILTVILLSNFLTMGWSSVTAVARMGFALARDQAFPFSPWLKTLTKDTQVPVRVIWLMTVVNILLLLLPLVTPEGFNAIASSATIAFQISYAIPIIMRVTVARHKYTQAHFHLGRYSVPMSIVAAIWLIVTSVIFLFPTNRPVTAENLNYTFVVLGGYVVIGVLYWVLYARHHFMGPHQAILDYSAKDSVEGITHAHVNNTQSDTRADTQTEAETKAPVEISSERGRSEYDVVADTYISNDGTSNNDGTSGSEVSDNQIGDAPSVLARPLLERMT